MKGRHSTKRNSNVVLSVRGFVGGIAKEVSNELNTASVLNNIGAYKGGLVYCRHAMECIVKDQYLLKFHKIPALGKKNNSLLRQKLKLEKPISKLFTTLNKLTRKGAHHGPSPANPQNVVERATNLVIEIYDSFYPNDPLTMNVVEDGMALRQKALQKESSTIQGFGLEDSITDDLELLLAGYVELSRWSLNQGENLPVQQRAALGLALYHSGALKDAAEVFLTTIEMIGEDESFKALALCFAGLGQIARQRGEMEDSIAQYNTALEFYRSGEDFAGEMSVLCSLGDVKRKQGDDLDYAHNLFVQSLAIARKIKDERGESAVISSMADLARNQGELIKAEKLFLKALLKC